jgi:HD-like signal output (HDOD) protein
MRAFWRHAAACAVYASLLAASCPGTSPERVFVGGLLHDLGQLVILRKLPAAAGRALLLSRVEGLPDAEAETAVLGIDHAAVGRALLAGWHFPESLAAIAGDHHSPTGDARDRETALVHVADILATAWAWPPFAGSPVPALSEAAWRSLGLSESVLTEVAAAGDDRIRDIESIFFNPAGRPPQ